jgi:hypothetical protein
MEQLDKPVLKKGHGGARPGSGRPKFVPTDAERKQVEAMSGYGLPQEHIAVLIRDGISVDTLQEHFAAELKKGKAKANSQIGKTLFQKAMGGDTTAMIWWSKTQMKWSETVKTENKTEVTGADGEPVKMVIDEAINNLSMRIRSREL